MATFQFSNKDFETPSAFITAIERLGAEASADPRIQYGNFFQKITNLNTFDEIPAWEDILFEPGMMNEAKPVMEAVAKLAPVLQKHNPTTSVLLPDMLERVVNSGDKTWAPLTKMWEQAVSENKPAVAGLSM